MKRVLMAFTALMLTLMLTFAAVAEELRLSPGLAAQKLAIVALQEKYGLSRDSLGLFSVDVEADGEAMVVCFRPDCFLPAERVGEYVIRVAGESADAAWTHDDKEPALWQSGDPESPAWGEKQLQLCLNNNTSWLEPYLSEDIEGPVPPDVYDRLSFERFPSEADSLPSMVEEEALLLPQARDLADAALMAVYAMTADEVAALDHEMDAAYLVCDDGRILWEVAFADSERCYIILVDAITAEVFHITLASGGNG